MESSTNFSQVLADLRRQDEQAAQRVYQRFAQRLVGLAEKHLDQRLHKKVDPEDVAQSVLKSVLLRLGVGEFELGNWDSLWGLLVRFTLHRCARWGEFFHAGKRDIDRETTPQANDESAPSWEFVDREPSPEESLALAETIEQILTGLTVREQEIVTRSLQGDTVLDVSQALSCTESKVYRTLKRVRQRLESLMAHSQ